MWRQSLDRTRFRDKPRLMQAPEFPGAQPSEREYDFDSDGYRLHLHEWGDPKGRPIVLCHGMWDHSHAFDLLAPLLARRFRVVSIDARGHGDSEWLDSYAWMQDVADIVRVLRWLGHAHLLGHSRGGSLATHAACYSADSIGKLINIEGFGPSKTFMQPPGHRERPLPGTPGALTDFLDTRRRAQQRRDWRPYAELDDLVTRRRQQNPRLSTAWLRYFCWHGSRRDASGFRWKVDPFHGIGAGPWKPDWIKLVWQRVKIPVLALIASEDDTWGPIDNELLDERLGAAPCVERARVANAGHFPHMEQPVETARLVLDYLAA
jgi:pimeloyl-ACP methyl ester carboxylesterase